MGSKQMLPPGVERNILKFLVRKINGKVVKNSKKLMEIIVSKIFFVWIKRCESTDCKDFRFQKVTFGWEMEKEGDDYSNAEKVFRYQSLEMS